VKELWLQQLLLLRDRLKRNAPKIGFPLFYVFCLILFSSWTFPYAKLKDRIIVAFNAQQRAAGSAQELSIDDVSSSWLTGIKMTDIRLISPPSDVASGGGGPSKPSELKVDEAVARIALFPLLVGNRDISYHLKAMGGTVDGSYDDRGTSNSIEANIEGVDTAQLTPLTDLLGLPIEGVIGGVVKLDMPEGKAAKANGTIAIDIRDLAVGDGKAKIKGLLALPRLNVGTLTFAAEAKDGALRVTKFGAGGKDVELQGDGRVQFRELAVESNLDLNIRFKINDAYRNKSDATKALFGAPGSNVPPVFELADPRIKQAKRPDGFYGWHAHGPLSHPDFTPVAVASPLTAPGGFNPPLGGAVPGVKAN
jgi:type II secretion system protein N